MKTFALRAALLACATGGALQGLDAEDRATGSPSLGRVEISTVPLRAGLVLYSATYTPSGKVLVSYGKQGTTDERDLSLAIMNDDGTGFRPIFSRRVPDRPKDNGLRYMVFADNRRVLLGDFVLECGGSLDTCAKPALLPVTFPAEVASGDHIAHRWSEVAVAPDNRHVAWTTLLANFSAVVFTGELQRGKDGYRIVAPHIVSTSDPFGKDSRHPDGTIPLPVRGGEVKQFVRGGQALSLVGAIDRDTPDSVVQDLATGRLQGITDTPGYTETTIFSPDERLGLTMTTRFSPSSDPAVLGLLPRPYPASLNMGLSMFAYTYAVTGVRKSRAGNVGPALIEIAASQKGGAYLGTNLNTQPDWVYYSPMSWHPDSRRAMWIEGQRGTAEKRIRIVKLPDYRAGLEVAARPTPEAIPYASSDLSAIPGLAEATKEAHVKVYGRASGYITYDRTASSITKTYVNFSDDGASTYEGRERTQADPRANSTYEADVRLTGKRSGVMKLKMTFGPLGGPTPARIVFERDTAGTPASHGYAQFEGRRIEVGSLVP
ncbi:MAG TPA: hypothetical protein VMQ93_19200 [Novosphingobium sp.]|nr:hypothetical protein [Novosphingobium sp.]